MQPVEDEMLFINEAIAHIAQQKRSLQRNLGVHFQMKEPIHDPVIQGDAQLPLQTQDRGQQVYGLTKLLKLTGVWYNSFKYCIKNGTSCQRPSPPNREIVSMYPLEKG